MEIILLKLLAEENHFWLLAAAQSHFNLRHCMLVGNKDIV